MTMAGNSDAAGERVGGLCDTRRDLAERLTGIGVIKGYLYLAYMALLRKPSHRSAPGLWGFVGDISWNSFCR